MTTDITNLVHAIDLQRAYADCCRADAVKNDLFENLIERINALQRSVAQGDKDLKEQKVLTQHYHDKADEQDSEIRTLRRQREQTSFVSVLIDGDITLFQDEYIRRGEAGGLAAAQELRNEIQHHLESIDLSSRVIVNIYANFSGLKKAYGYAGIPEFVKGFNMFHALYQMIEAGDGKECADEKVKSLFQIFVDDIHCKKIIFGGSGDNGYARLLKGFEGNEKITLLEGFPVAREIALLEPPFEKITFERLFRSTKIELAPSQTMAAVVSAQVASKPIKLTIADIPQASTATWAATASTAQSPHTKEVVVPVRRPISHPYEDGFEIYKNSNGQRVDEPLNVSPSQIQEIKPRKLCNQYHLFNNCQHAGSSCAHKHGTKLTEKEFLAQRVLARRSPCWHGIRCSDPWCSSGHQCPYGPNCPQTNCKFPVAMHGVDSRIVKDE